MSEQARLENTMIGESVIWMDADSVRRAAFIIAAHDQGVVDLIVFGQDGIFYKVLKAIFSSTDQPLRWWRRIRF